VFWQAFADLASNEQPSNADTSQASFMRCRIRAGCFAFGAFRPIIFADSPLVRPSASLSVDHSPAIPCGEIHVVTDFAAICADGDGRALLLRLPFHLVASLSALRPWVHLSRFIAA
jgi:hypothetical protein